MKLTIRDTRERLAAMLADRQSRRELARCQLSARERTILHFRFFHGLTRRQTAESLKITIDQVRSVEMRALRQVRRFFEMLDAVAMAGTDGETFA
ncbi:MAG: sigma factor-like helix-turn-helix DNA-binding protein [bacterium]